MIQIRNLASSTVEKAQAPVTLKINSEEEYEIVESSDTEKDKLFKNQKNKMSVYSDSVR